MPLVSALFAAVGVYVVLAGLWDAFLTILHPDRDGRFSSRLNRLIWRLAVLGARGRGPATRSAVLGMAGPAMVVADILLWMIMPIVGYGVLIAPFLSGGFETPPSLGTDLWDAIYFSGVTFTTLGFGDITPLTPGWEVLSVAEAVTGFLVMSTSIAYMIAVFEGVDHRDAMALQIYSETGGTWNGSVMLVRGLSEEGEEAMRQRLEAWATLVRELHGRLYRFHGLALYLRTHGLEFGPERMLYGLADVALQAKVAARSPALSRLGPAADHLATGLDHFAAAMVRRYGSKAIRKALESPVPTDEDVRALREAWAAVGEPLGLPAPETPLERDRGLLILATRLRIFRIELERLTLWSQLTPGTNGRP